MLRRVSEGAAAGAAVDTAAIATAVAAALTIPSADENALAVADLLVIPTPPTTAEIATELAVQDKLYDIAGIIVGAVPNTTAIETRCRSAIVAETGQYGAIRALVDPTTYLLASGEQTGTTEHLLQFFSIGQRPVVWGFVITSDAATTLQWRSGIGATVGDAHPVSANQPWVLSPSSKKTYRFNQEDALFLLSSNSAAKLHITYWFSYEDF